MWLHWEYPENVAEYLLAYKSSKWTNYKSYENINQTEENQNIITSKILTRVIACQNSQ